MRSGACPAQRTLSAEAVSVLKQSLSLARQRGHAQVTPLHVATTLLSSRDSLLRRACLKSQPYQPSHSLQCRALELCFNVALNRLPATPSPLLHAQPCLSNALIAALKRAQAHQRRGCIENQQQQQSLISVKVDLEQLILSILDDPSVSRVMREAGFSSTAVKNNLEGSPNPISSVFQCYNTNGGIYSTPNSPPTELTQRELFNPRGFWHSQLLPYSSQEKNPFLFSPQSNKKTNQLTDPICFKEENKVLYEILLMKNRRNVVIVGDTLSMAEELIGDFMGKVEKGDVPEDLKSAHFIKFQFSSVPLKFMKKEEVEMNIADLKKKVDSFGVKNGKVIIYTGDLKWAVEETSTNGGYSPVDHLIAEIGKLLSWYELGYSTRVWLMGIANYQTYTKCQVRQPPLDLQWCLQAVSVPSSGLSLSLSPTSGQNSRITLSQSPEEPDILTCCPECKSNYEKEALNKDFNKSSPQLSSWLQPQGKLVKEDFVQLKRKYNTLCQSLHHGSHHPNSSNSFTNANPCNLGKNYFQDSSNTSWPKKNNIFADSETISFGYPALKSNLSASNSPGFRRQQSCHNQFSFSSGSSNHQPNLDSLKNTEGKEFKITLGLGNSIYDEAPSTEKIVIIQENVPWQLEIVPLILEAISQDKFLLIQGNDLVGKRRLAIGIAKAVFGSSEFLFCMNMRNNANTVSQNREMLEKALNDHEKLVILIEDADFADPEFVHFLETRKLEGSSGSAIFILTMNEDTGSVEAREQNMDSVINMKLIVKKSTFDPGMPKVDKKRKSSCDFSFRAKNRRDNENGKLSLHALDLNIKADEDESKFEELSPILSDLKIKVPMEKNLLKFLNLIKNRFVLNTNSNKNDQATDMFLSKFKNYFEEANGNRKITNFNADEMVLDEIFKSSGFFLNDLFEEWLKDVFQTSLHGVDTGEGDTISVRLCLDGKGVNCAEGGFMGTCLPKRIQVSFIV